MTMSFSVVHSAPDYQIWAFTNCAMR